MTRRPLTLFIFVFTVLIGQAQTDSLKFPNTAKLPDKFEKAVKEQTKEYNRLFYRDSATTKNYSVSFILDKIDNDSNNHYIFLAEYWIAFH